MYSTVATAAVFGIESIVIQVEADVCDGLPIFEMVGVLGSEVREAKERIRAAIRNTDIKLPPKRITINLHPANIRKCGTGFDLPIAIALLAAYGIIENKFLKGTLFIGEISLDGRIHPVTGILPMTLAAKEAGFQKLMIPRGNETEASYVKGIKILPAESLREALAIIRGSEPIVIPDGMPAQEELLAEGVDFKDINGQQTLRRALEVAASGMHNMLMSGPPGAGKTMAARALPTILPFLKEEEEMELIKIYSIIGAFDQRRGNRSRPFRDPHHTITSAALAGGGRSPRPGEISLAHKGILFLDEMTEFARNTLETLRQPLEDKMILLARMEGVVRYPADFLLIGAVNPCACGYYPDRNKCNCKDASIIRHLNKISKPLLDRFDLWVEVPKMKWQDLKAAHKNESSETIKKRVLQAHKLQRMRYADLGFSYNSQIPSAKVHEYCKLEPKALKTAEAVFEKHELSVRGYYKMLKTARTIADLDHSDLITEKNIYEAFLYRNMRY